MRPMLLLPSTSSVFTRSAVVWLVFLLALSCGQKPPVRVEPEFYETPARRILILPVTGVSDAESRAMIEVMTKMFREERQYEVVFYTSGQLPEFDRILELARQMRATIPLDLIPQLGKISRADAVIVTHQSSMAQDGGVAHRFESGTEAAIRRQKTLDDVTAPEPGDGGGYAPVNIAFPDGLIRIQLLESASRRRLWEAQTRLESFGELRRLLEKTPQRPVHGAQ